jgi:hypothetical protein
MKEKEEVPYETDGKSKINIFLFQALCLQREKKDRIEKQTNF